MTNHKYLLMDFYLNLLSIPEDHRFRIANQKLYAEVRDAMAFELDTSPEIVHNIFERMVKEDKENSNPANSKCPAHRSNIHSWYRRNDRTAICKSCNLELNKFQADEICWGLNHQLNE